MLQKLRNVFFKAQETLPETETLPKITKLERLSFCAGQPLRVPDLWLDPNAICYHLHNANEAVIPSPDSAVTHRTAYPPITLRSRQQEVAARQLGSRIPGHVAFAILHVREIRSDRPQELMVTATVENNGRFRKHLHPRNLDLKRVVAEKLLSEDGFCLKLDLIHYLPGFNPKKLEAQVRRIFLNSQIESHRHEIDNLRKVHGVDRFILDDRIMELEHKILFERSKLMGLKDCTY